MRRLALLVVALLPALAAARPASAQAPAGTPPQPTILVGRVIEADPTTRQVKVKAGTEDWTLRIADNAKVLSGLGERADLSRVSRDHWVRVEGWQTNPLTLRVIQVHAIGDNEAFQASHFNKPGSPQGYVTRVEANKLTVQPISVSGKVTQINRPMGYFVVVSQDGKEHTVYIEGTKFRRGANATGFEGLKEGDKVQVTGRMMSSGRPQ